MREKQPTPYPAEKARGGEIILRRPWQRVVFIFGLALPLLLLIRARDPAFRDAVNHVAGPNSAMPPGR